MPLESFGQVEITDMIPTQVKAQIPQTVLTLLKGVKTPLELQAKIENFLNNKNLVLLKQN